MLLYIIHTHTMCEYAKFVLRFLYTHRQLLFIFIFIIIIFYKVSNNLHTTQYTRNVFDKKIAEVCTPTIVIFRCFFAIMTYSPFGTE